MLTLVLKVKNKFLLLYLNEIKARADLGLNAL
jgi:hypothetical protein